MDVLARTQRLPHRGGSVLGTSLEALKFANAAAALSVQKHGAGLSMPHKDEIQAFLKQAAA
jgi:sugar/nucleoside kinase (ribokinase family)